MADLFPALALGDCLDEAQATIINMKVGTTVTKGQIVQAATHTVGELCSVEPGMNGSGTVVGIALKSGEAGVSIPVLVKGVAKVTSANVVAVGGPVRAGANGTVKGAVNTVTIPSGTTTVTSSSAQPSMLVEGGIAFAVALQAFVADDTGLILL